MIILEGFDNSGKSTLAKRFGLEVLHPGPAPRTVAEELGCLMQQHSHASKPVVHDRVTCISSQVYRNRLGDERYMAWLNAMLATPHCILIYCRPPLEYVLDFRQHEAKAYDTIEKLAELQASARERVALYDMLMTSIPHAKYDWTHPDAVLFDIKTLLHTQIDFGSWQEFRKVMRR